MLKTDDVDSMQALSLAAILTSFCQPNTKCSVVSSTQIYSNLSRRHHNLAQNPCLDIRRKNIGSSLGAQCAKQKDIYLRGLSCWSEVAGAGDAHGSELRHIHWRTGYCLDVGEREGINEFIPREESIAIAVNNIHYDQQRTLQWRSKNQISFTNQHNWVEKHEGAGIDCW